MKNDTLRLTEMFYSLQGETNTAGLPTLFIRLTGCPLRCHYCDTEYAFHGGTTYPFQELFEKVEAYKPQNICVTGGEPLAQPNCKPFINHLIEQGYKVSVETSGSIDISGIHSKASIVLDLKTPDSGESSKNLYSNIKQLQANDHVKFVICSRQDYEWARFKLDEFSLKEKVDEVLFSPSASQLDATALADWIIEDNLPVRFQLQLHKLLWDDEPGH